MVWLASSGVPPGLGAPNSRGVFSSPSNSAGSWTIRPPPSTRRALTLACPHTVLPGLYYARSPAPCLAHPLRRGTLAVGLQPPAVPPPRRPQCPASGNAVETLETAELAPLCIISSLSPTPGLGPPPECRCGCGCEGVFPPPPLGRCRTRTRTRRPRTRPDSQTCVQQPAALGRSPASGYYDARPSAGSSTSPNRVRSVSVPESSASVPAQSVLPFLDSFLSTLDSRLEPARVPRVTLRLTRRASGLSLATHGRGAHAAWTWA